MKLFRNIILIVIAAVAGFGGYSYFTSGIVFEFLAKDTNLSADEANALYKEMRPQLLEMYKKGGDPVAVEYDNWQAASTGPANPGVHGERYLMSFVNDIGFDEYVKYETDVEMPTGSIIAKESFKIKGDSKFIPGPLFIMEKVGVDAAPDADGWLYQAIKPNGKPMNPSQDFCHSCHAAFSAQDSLGFPAKEARIGYVAPLPGAVTASVSAGDPALGEQVFQACASCHQVGANAKNAFGPVLTDIVGRPAASFPGYRYSADLEKAGNAGLVWDEQQLFEWLAGPSGFLKKYHNDQSATSNMPIEFDSAEDRNNVIAYLQSLSGDVGMVEKTHGDTPSETPREATSSTPDEYDNLPRTKLELVAPPFVPEHSQRAQGGPKIVEVDLTVVEKEWTVDNKGTKIIGLTYNGSIPAPMIVVHQGDFVELTLTNPSTNRMEHNIDLHAATGALGGAAITTIVPGEETVLRFEATKAGVFLYHCAPEGVMTPYHVTHGMTGAILVLPRDGLKDENGNSLTYDKAYYIGENDFYVPKDANGNYKSYSVAGEDLIDWVEAMHTLTPSHIVFNGRVGALTGEGAMTAEVGDKVMFPRQSRYAPASDRRSWRLCLGDGLFRVAAHARSGNLVRTRGVGWRGAV